MTTVEKLETPLAAVPTRPDSEHAPAPGTLYVAVVHAGDGIRFVTAAQSRVELVRRLADYVRQRGDDMLWAADARHLRALIARGELEAAVEVYFGLVGDRWDEESLVTAVVTADGRPEMAQALTEEPRGEL